MNYAEDQRNPGKHMVGIGVVVVMHIILGWALLNGLARKVVEVIKAPIETKIIEEVKPPPPPPPENLPPPPPKMAPPPPSFVPPPEVNVPPPPTPAPAITVTREEPPPAPPVAIAPPPAPVPAPPAPPAPPAVAARPAQIDATNPNCKPTYPSAALRAQVEGITRIRFTVDANGKVSKAEIVGSSGSSREHKLLDRAAVESLGTCPFKPGIGTDGKPTGGTANVDYTWKLE